jgi:hypothetical protein
MISREAAIEAVRLAFKFDPSFDPTIKMATSAIRALPTVQPDAAAIREAALRDAISHARQALVDAAYNYRCTSRSSAMFTAEDHVTVALSRLIDNTGKEVMPPVPVNNTPNEPDIGPSDQAVAGAAAHGAEHWDTLAPWSKYGSDVVLVVHHILTEPAVPTATVRFELPERAGSDVLGHCAADTVEEAVIRAIDAAQTKLRAMIDTGKKTK